MEFGIPSKDERRQDFLDEALADARRVQRVCLRVFVVGFTLLSASILTAYLTDHPALTLPGAALGGVTAGIALGLAALSSKHSARKAADEIFGR